MYDTDNIEYILNVFTLSSAALYLECTKQHKTHTCKQTNKKALRYQYLIVSIKQRSIPIWGVKNHQFVVMHNYCTLILVVKGKPGVLFVANIPRQW